jgi:GNAT superfamily N-acetyltransferase
MSLVRCTEAESRERDRRSALDWEPDLCVPEFVAREQVLQRTAFARRSRVPWGWVVDGETVSSTETYEVAWPAGRVWLVASVWTDPDHRGRGHASAMLDALAERCAGVPGAAALVLFSDVGPALYERVGFVALPAVDVVWPASVGDPDDGPWERFAESALHTLDPRDPAQLDWQLDRARTRAELRPVRRPSRCGARLPSGAWMVWADDGHDRELQVLEARVATVEEWSTLATAAARTASAAGLGAVVAWDPALAVPGERRPRVGKLPMARPLGAARVSGLGPVPRSAWV